MHRCAHVSLSVMPTSCSFYLLSTKSKYRGFVVFCFNLQRKQITLLFTNNMIVMISVATYLLNYYGSQYSSRMENIVPVFHEEMELESHSCAVDKVCDCTFLVPWPTDPDQSVKTAYFCLVSSAQTINYSKTFQDALAEIVSVLLLWLSCLPLQFLPVTIPKYKCSLIAIFKLLHSLVLYFLIISGVEQAKFANALLVSSVWVK